jgi:hypothetical protein
MRKLDTSSINSSRGMPIKSGTLNHIQAAYQEAISAIVQNIIGPSYSLGVGYVLSGCVNTGSGASSSGINYSISPGAIFYNGEVFLVPSQQTFTTTSSTDVGVAVINTLFDSNPADNADPVTFTDGSQVYVYQIRTIAFQAYSVAPSATIFNFADMVGTAVNITSSNTSLLTVSGTFPNIILNPQGGGSGSSSGYPIFYYGTMHPGDVEGNPTATANALDPQLQWLSGNSSNDFNGYLYTFPNGYTTPDTNYLVLVTVRNDSYIDGTGLCTNNGVSIQIGRRLTTGFYLGVSTTDSGRIQNVFVDYFLVQVPQIFTPA